MSLNTKIIIKLDKNMDSFHKGIFLKTLDEITTKYKNDDYFDNGHLTSSVNGGNGDIWDIDAKITEKSLFINN